MHFDFRSPSARALLVFTAAVTALSVAGCGSTAAMAQGGGARGAQKSSAINVNIAYAERETLERQTEFAGKLEASQTIKVYPEVSGTVAAVYFNAGDTVKKGDLLFELDSVDAETALRQAELSYQKTMAGLDSDESGSGNALTELKYQNAIKTAQNKYESAREDLEYATENDFVLSDFKQARKKLWDTEKAYDADESTANWTAYVAALKTYNELLDNYASYSNYKNQITTFENAYDDYLQAVEEYDIYKSVTSGEEAATRDISRSQAELTLESAQRTYDNHKIYAPVSGVIAARNASAYDVVSTQSAAFVISQEGMPSVSFNLSEDGANAMDIGTPVTVIYSGKEYPAEVTELAPEADSATGLYSTKAQLLADIGTNRSGAVLKVRAITAQEKDTLTISLDHIYYDGNQAYVFVYDNGTARRANVTVGMTTTDKVSIIEGLSDTDAVITTWHPRLKDGAEVINSALLGASQTDTPAADAAPAGKEG